jgi:glycogen debranching enzyme
MSEDLSVNPWADLPRIGMGPGGTISLVEGSTFLISDARGDVLPSGAQGLFHRDTRFLSRLELLVDGQRPEPLAARTIDPYSARFVLRVPLEGPGESPIVAVRNRFVGDGLHEDLDITNHGLQPVELAVEFLIEADFADLFEVKALGRGRSTDVTRRIVAEQRLLELEYVHDGFRRATEVRLTAHPEEITASGARFRITLPPGETWHTCIEVCLNLGATRCLPKCRCEAFGSLPAPLAKRAAAWRRGFPKLRSGWDALDHLYRQSVDDLSALLMEDPDGRGDLVVAAGLPWFMTLFGRDAILTALMALPFDHELAAGVLRTLARHQGAKEDETSEEQPGRILHEIRFGEVALRTGTNIYYGTVDATPLFVTLVAEAHRWGLAWDEVEALLPNVRRALGWMRTHGDPDGDGYLEYPGRTDRGLRNQGWKDSWDAVQFADGTLAEGPIALSEVQGYAYRALLDAAYLFDAAGERTEAEVARAEATMLAERFRRDFWLEEVDYPALALDGEKRQVDAVASNAGHLLWTGILSAEQEAQVARRLASPELFSGWGLRTLATSNRGYNPVSYHVGSVWPHDTAIAVAGLVRTGFEDTALTLARGLLDAAPFFSYRLPELFSGFPRDAFGFPVGYPTTSSPQAWAAASVLLLIRALLGLEPDGAGERLNARPILPPGALPLRLEGLRLGPRQLSLRVDRDGSVELTEVPGG